MCIKLRLLLFVTISATVLSFVKFPTTSIGGTFFIAGNFRVPSKTKQELIFEQPIMIICSDFMYINAADSTRAATSTCSLNFCFLQFWLHFMISGLHINVQKNDGKKKENVIVYLRTHSFASYSFSYFWYLRCRHHKYVGSCSHFNLYESHRSSNNIIFFYFVWNRFSSWAYIPYWYLLWRSKHNLQIAIDSKNYYAKDLMMKQQQQCICARHYIYVDCESFRVDKMLVSIPIFVYFACLVCFNCNCWVISIKKGGKNGSQSIKDELPFAHFPNGIRDESYMYTI